MTEPKVPGLWDDIKIRIVLCAWFALAAIIYFLHGLFYLKKLDGAQSDLTRNADGFSLITIAIFSLIVSLLYVIRLRPINKLRGVVPTAAALLGAFLIFGLMFLKPRMDLPPMVKIIATALIVVGYICAIFALIQLGRSFSILPEARKLVTSGIYRYIRHPMYLSEFLVLTGIFINFLSPIAAIIVVAQIIFQFRRMDYEEQILRSTFPEYEDYSHHTARLIPGLY
jgi:protein-S-isoprenylcysteine O-methyltransferase Ste14